MATENQTAYINTLIDGLRIENMEWIRELTLTGNRREWKIQTWLDGALHTRDYDKEVAFENTIAAYNARLDEIATAEMDTREASRTIDNLKKCNLVW